LREPRPGFGISNHSFFFSIAGAAAHDGGWGQKAGRQARVWLFLSFFLLGDTFIVGRQSSFLDFFFVVFWLHRVE
jgi:hypothetical protein